MSEQQLSKWLVEVECQGSITTIVAASIESVKVDHLVLSFRTKYSTHTGVFKTPEEALAAYHHVQQAMGRAQ
jgi:hypothetical protein